MKYKSHYCKILDADANKPIVAQVSSAAVDSDGDVIWQGPSEKGSGWLLDDFNARGGRVYWMHNPFVPNLAKARAWVDSDRLLMSVEFDMEDELAAKLDRKVRAGYVDEWSVGFKMLDFSPRKGGGLDIYTSELAEVSPVNQGSNPSTAVMSKSMAEAADIVKVYEDRIRVVEAELMGLARSFDEYKAAQVLRTLRIPA